MKYKFRCEFKHDANLIKESLSFWITSWVETPLMLRISENEVYASPVDLEVVFELTDDSPDLEKIKSLIGTIIDCHVAEETIQLESNYTGERVRNQT